MKKLLIIFGLIVSTSAYAIPENTEIGQQVFQGFADACVRKMAKVEGATVGDTVVKCGCFAHKVTGMITEQEVYENTPELAEAVDKKIAAAEKECF